MPRFLGPLLTPSTFSCHTVHASKTTLSTDCSRHCSATGNATLKGDEHDHQSGGTGGDFLDREGTILAVIFRTCDQWTSSTRQINTSLAPRDIPVQTQPDFYWSNGSMTAAPGDRRHTTHAKAAPKDSTETGRNEYRFSSAFMICGDYNSNFLMQPVVPRSIVHLRTLRQQG